MTVLRRWQPATAAVLICVCAVFVCLSSAPRQALGAVQANHGSIVLIPGGTYLGWPPYPNPPKVASVSQASGQSNKAVKYECGSRAVFVDEVQTSFCVDPWAGLCYQLHNWGRGCSAYYYIHTPSAEHPWRSYWATYYWQVIAGKVVEVQPWASFKWSYTNCGPSCKTGAPDRR